MRLIVYDDQIKRNQSEYFEGQKVADFEEILLMDKNNGLLDVTENSFDIQIKNDEINFKIQGRDRDFYSYDEIFITNDAPSSPSVVKKDRMELTRKEGEDSFYNIPLFKSFSRKILSMVKNRINNQYKGDIECDFENLRHYGHNEYVFTDSAKLRIIRNELTRKRTCVLIV